MSLDSNNRLRPFLVVALTASLGVGLTVATAIWFWHDAWIVDHARFDRWTHSLTEELDFRTEKIQGLLMELQRTLASHPRPELIDWDEYVNQTSPQWNYPGLAALGYATNHQVDQMTRLLEPWLREEAPRSRAEFYSLPVELKQERQWSTWLIDIYRPDMAPYAAAEVSPLSPGNSSFPPRFHPREAPKFTERGVLLSVDGRLQSLNANATPVEDAITRDEIKVTAREPVLRSTQGEPFEAVLMLAPVAHPARRRAWIKLSPDPAIKAEEMWLRWQLNAGLVFACLDYPAMLRDIQGETVPEVRVEIYCDIEGKTESSPASWLNPMAGGMRAAGAGPKPSLTQLNQWAMYGTKWNLFFYTTPQFDRVSTRFRAAWATAFGLVGTALICALLSVQIRARLAEVKRSQELKEARSALQAAQRQRERLSHDLHDGAIQSLYAVQLGLTGVERELDQIKSGAGGRLKEARSGLDQVITELRNFIVEMQDDKTPVRSGSLVGVLQSLVRRLRGSSGASIELECDAAASDALTSRQAVQLGAIAREALSNSLRHSGARQMKVNLAFAGDQVRLEIIDDGCGFDPQAVNGRGMGIGSMRHRAEELNAQLVIQSAAGAGTRVICSLVGQKRPADGT